MAIVLCEHPAPGGPGIEPRWTRSDKDGVGTAYSALSRVWFTVSKGILNEVYYPTIDRPQIRDLQYLISDGATFFHDERHLDNTHEYLAANTLGSKAMVLVSVAGNLPLAGILWQDLRAMRWESREFWTGPIGDTLLRISRGERLGP